ncbi:MAG: CidA/LrgA family protein [Oscillospiraceae bacterium]|nr:CidA/LrgA family protein [Oscillospiraceae bacterium]
MKFVKQFAIILSVSFIGELLNYLIPLPVPSSIYGLIIMFLCLCLKIIKVEDVRETSSFLIEVMPLMFIPAAVGLITSWDILRSDLMAYIVITVVTTFLVMIVSGHVTQYIMRRSKKEEG